MSVVLVMNCKTKVLDAMRRAKARGFSDVLYLDAETKKNIEEVSAANIFLVKVKKENLFL